MIDKIYPYNADIVYIIAAYHHGLNLKKKS